ncbi:hypothetical protein D3C81_1215880 [compost metagenome]
MSTMLSKLAISGPVWLTSSGAYTAIRTLIHLSPSIRSSPPRPSIRSLPLPPRMMLPVAKPVVGKPASARNCSSPRINATLVSALPVAPPWLRMVTASTSSPLSTSPNLEPDNPSTSAKRSRIEAGEAPTGLNTPAFWFGALPWGCASAARLRSTVTPTWSFL